MGTFNLTRPASSKSSSSEGKFNLTRSGTDNTLSRYTGNLNLNNRPVRKTLPGGYSYWSYPDEPNRVYKESRSKLTTEMKNTVRGGSFAETGKEIDHVISRFAGGTIDKRGNLDAKKSPKSFWQKVKGFFGDDDAKKVSVDERPADKRQEGKAKIEAELSRKFDAGEMDLPEVRLHLLTAHERTKDKLRLTTAENFWGSILDGAKEKLNPLNTLKSMKAKALTALDFATQPLGDVSASVLAGDSPKETFQKGKASVVDSLDPDKKRQFSEILDQELKNLRGTTNLAAVPVSGLFASVPGGVTPMEAMVEQIDMAEKMFDPKSGQSLGYNMHKAGQQYLQKRGVGKYGGKKPNVADIGALAMLGFFDMFGDPAFEFGIGLKTAKELKQFALYRKVASVKQSLKADSKIINPTKRVFDISSDQRVVVKPSKNTVVIEGFVKRSKKADNLPTVRKTAYDSPNAGKSITPYLDDVNDIAGSLKVITGHEIEPALKGGDLILKMGEPIAEAGAKVVGAPKSKSVSESFFELEKPKKVMTMAERTDPNVPIRDKTYSEYIDDLETDYARAARKLEGNADDPILLTKHAVASIKKGDDLAIAEQGLNAAKNSSKRDYKGLGSKEIAEAEKILSQAKEFGPSQPSNPETGVAISENFQSKTGISNYDDMIDGSKIAADGRPLPQYYAETKGQVGKIVKMTPDNYIEASAKGFGKSVDEIISSRAADTVAKYTNMFKSGGKAPVLVLDYSKGFTQEGLNRALAARQAGIKEIPVLRVTKPSKVSKQFDELERPAETPEEFEEIARQDRVKKADEGKVTVTSSKQKFKESPNITGNVESRRSKIRSIIEDKGFKGVDALFDAAGLPPVSKMDTNQLAEAGELLSSRVKGEEFLTKKQIESNKYNSLKDARSYKDVEEMISKETGKTVREMDPLGFGLVDRFSSDTMLAQKHPLMKVMIENAHAGFMQSTAEFLKKEEIYNDLIKKARKSRKKSIGQKLKQAISPTDKIVFDYLDGKKSNLSLMTPEEKTLATYLKEILEEALLYELERGILEHGVDNYITQTRRGFLEAATKGEFGNAFKELFVKYKPDEQPFNIGKEGNISTEKHFKYAMKRTGGIKPSENLSKALGSYFRALEQKKVLDDLLPKIALYTETLAKVNTMPNAKAINESANKFISTWVDNKKGLKPEKFIEQGGVVDLTLAGFRNFAYWKYLGFNIAVGATSALGEQIGTFIQLGNRLYAKANYRLATKKGRAIVKKYDNFVGRSVLREIGEPSKDISDKFNEGGFGLFTESGRHANKTFLLGKMTDAEWKSGVISNKRLGELNVEMGKYRVVANNSSLFTSTSLGKSAVQFKKWALPVLQSEAANITKLSKRLLKGDVKGGLSSTEAKELARSIQVTAIMLGLGSLLFGKDDDSFVGKFKEKLYRDSLTVLSAVNPATFIALPTLGQQLKEIGTSLFKIIQAEKGDDGGLTGVKELKKQFSPGDTAAVKQFSGGFFPKDDKKKKGKFDLRRKEPVPEGKFDLRR